MEKEEMLKFLIELIEEYNANYNPFLKQHDITELSSFYSYLLFKQGKLHINKTTKQ